MKYILLLLLLITVNCKAQSPLQVDFSYLGISIQPSKCSDTLNLKIEKGEFKNLDIKIFLENCNGQCKFILTGKNDRVRLTGFYENAHDTLVRYKNSKIMGKSKGQIWSSIRIQKYLEPLA